MGAALKVGFAMVFTALLERIKLCAQALDWTTIVAPRSSGAA
jgi:hypothetical protein